jgi:hypothetical protein
MALVREFAQREILIDDGKVVGAGAVAGTEVLT